MTRSILAAIASLVFLSTLAHAAPPRPLPDHKGPVVTIRNDVLVRDDLGIRIDWAR